MGQFEGKQQGVTNQTFSVSYLALSTVRVVPFTLRFSATLLTPLMNFSQKYGRLLLADFRRKTRVDSRDFLSMVSGRSEVNRENPGLAKMSPGI